MRKLLSPRQHVAAISYRLPPQLKIVLLILFCAVASAGLAYLDLADNCQYDNPGKIKVGWNVYQTGKTNSSAKLCPCFSLSRFHDHRKEGWIQGFMMYKVCNSQAH